jgi:ribonucleases P/MRP protein subunit RPP40
MIQWPNP